MITAVEVKLNGSDLSAEQMDRLAEVSVEQSLYLPSMCTLHLYDFDISPSRAIHFDLLDTDAFAIGAELEVSLGYIDMLQVVFKGEITAVELATTSEQPPHLMVRAYDRAHRLLRGRHSRSFLNMADSDIASKLAQEVGLSAEVDTTNPVHDYVFQYNQTNWEFLRQRAARLGFECFVNDRVLHFAKARNGQQEAPRQKIGDNLIDVRVRMVSSFQASQVVVRAWDMKSKEAVVGTASSGSAAPEIGESRNGKAIAADFGDATEYIVSQPLNTQSEANAMATAIYDQLDGTFVEAEGTCYGEAALVPGATVSLPNLGNRLSGKYYVTAATHTLTSNSMYTTSFTVSGRRSESLYDLVQAGGSQSTLPNAVVGLVTNNTDPDGLGRVKVKFPWLDDTEESWWARPASPMAGASRGFFVLPEINDEVLVTFEHGDITRPFILGSLWNGKDAPPKTNNEVVTSSKVNQRIWKTRAGHTIMLDDTEGSEKISIIDKTENNKLEITASDNTIALTAAGDVKLTATGKVVVNSTGDTTVDAQNATVTAKQNATVNATAQLKLHGATVAVEADGQLELKAAGVVTIQGALVKIN
jgi:uncharacterized protein involved in type VI secretion and phage assembly